MVKKKIIDFSVTYDCERIFKVVCFLFPVWFLSQFMAIVCVLNELVFSLFYKANKKIVARSYILVANLINI